MKQKVLIIHPQDESTDFLKPIYAGIEHKTLVTGGITKDELRQLVKEHDRVMMMGHGFHSGLFSVGRFPGAGTYIVDESLVDLLSEKKEGIYIWCYAASFVRRYNLHGFYSGMFISEDHEAFSCGVIPRIRDVRRSNSVFSAVMGKSITLPVEALYDTVKHEYGSLANENRVIKYNVELLGVNTWVREQDPLSVE